MDVTLTDGTAVTFVERLDFRAAQTITNAIQLFPQDDPAMRTAAILAMVTEYYLVFGIRAWSLDQPVTADNIRRELLDREDVDLLVEAANNLYHGQVIDPLARRASRSSEPSQTDAPTSPTPSGSKRSRKPSKPSSISTIPTVATEETSSSPDGAYSSSQNLELAG